jgi:hypothetical protein
MTLLAITAGGIAATAASAALCIAVAGMIYEKSPIGADFLLGHGIAQIANEICYGLTTFATDPSFLGHDFMRLWVIGGVHPLIPISLLLLIPAAVLLAAGTSARRE